MTRITEEDGTNPMPTNQKDHDLLVRLDEKVDNLGKILEALLKSLDARSILIDELKTNELLHKQETTVQWKRHDELAIRVNLMESHLENKASKDDVNSIERRTKDIETNIVILQQSSIMLWAQRHPKLAWTVIGTAIFMINFHDVVTPYLLSLLGLKLPSSP